ncbi:hypothetical protein BT63DRAFT_476853 [Microthyrium microscopicum]|uniref:DNA-directed RNA polymerase III subunit RPC3 n=1 Tax=Microthyrium microscopicum TaxID=703497 RepID=A0A6A6UKQ9_9PEZI|nr:hypothetical protein BT63DRAFT_476853 [Microthyrium microscopicum]
MQQDLAELTISGIDHLFGQLTSRVYAALAYTGRRTIQEICKRTGLNSRQVGTTLTVLTQQRLVVYHTEELNTSPVSLRTYFEADGDTAYQVVFRYQKLERVIHQRHGPTYASVLARVALMGFVTLSDLEKAFDFTISIPNGDSDKAKTHVNGSLAVQEPEESTQLEGALQAPTPRPAKQHTPKSARELKTILFDLARLGYISKRTKYSSMPHYVFITEATERVLNSYPGGPKGKDGKAEYAGNLDVEKRERRDEADVFAQKSVSTWTPATSNALKRKNRENEESSGEEEIPVPKKSKLSNELTNGSTKISKGRKRKNQEAEENSGEESVPVPKKSKLSNGLSNGSHGEVTSSLNGDSEELVFQVNLDKCNVIIRNQQLVKLAHRYLGETTSKVYGLLLRMLEPLTARCFDPLDSREQLRSDDEPLFEAGKHPTLRQILDQIPTSLDLATGVTPSGTTNGVNGHASKSKVVHSGSDLDTEPEDSATIKARELGLRRSLLEKHLRILEHDPRKFAFCVDSKWGVHFKRLTRDLVQYEILNTVTAQQGLLAGRVLRILQSNFSIDEKGIATQAILKPKDLREVTNNLLEAGIIETQEIPRDTNRTTNRLLWLYAYSAEKARKRIVTDCYRAMIRLMRRTEVERGKYSATIDKADRGDGVVLTSKDKRLLEEWGQKETLLWGQILRVDDVVSCLRDFAPEDDPFIGNRARPGTNPEKDEAKEEEVEEEGAVVDNLEEEELQDAGTV